MHSPTASETKKKKRARKPAAEAQWIVDLKSAWEAFPELVFHLNEILDLAKAFQRKLEETKDIKKLEKLEAEKAAVAGMSELEGEIDSVVSSYKQAREATAEQIRDIDALQTRYQDLVVQYRRRVVQIREEVDQLSSDVMAAPAVQDAIETFNKHVEALKERVQAMREAVNDESASDPRGKPAPVPWQVEYSASATTASASSSSGENDDENESGNDSDDDKPIVNFYGGTITDRFGRDIWEDRCTVLGSTIQSGAFGEGAKRFRSIQSKGAIRSELGHRWQSIMQNRVVEPRSYQDTFVEDYNHPVMAHTKVVEFATRQQPSREEEQKQLDCPHNLLGRALHAAFVVNKHKPLFSYHQLPEEEEEETGGGKRKGGAVVTKSYGEVHKEAFRVAHFLWQTQKDAAAVTAEESRDDASPAAVGIWLPNSPVWLLADFACTLNHQLSVGLHQEWPLPEVLYVLHHANIRVLVAEREKIESFQEFVRERLASEEGRRTPLQEQQLQHALAGVQFVTPSKIQAVAANEQVPAVSATPGLTASTPIDNEAAEQKSHEDDGTSKQTMAVEKAKEKNNNKGKTKAKKTKKLSELGDNLWTLMYSSGTTGSLKAIEVTHAAWYKGNVQSTHYDLRPYVVLSYTPLAHGLDRGMCWGAVFNDGRIHFAAPTLPSGDAEEALDRKLLELCLRTSPSSAPPTTARGLPQSPAPFPKVLHQVAACEPSIFVATPDFWSAVYRALEDRDLVKWLLPSEHEGGELELAGGPCCQLAVALKKLLFGRRIGTVATGAAPISPAVFSFFEALFAATLHPEEDKEEDVTSEETKALLRSRDVDGIWHFTDAVEHTILFSNVYGATEAPGISTNGVIRSNLELQLVDVPELGYAAAKGEGEIVVRGSGVAKRYFKNPRATAEVFKEGGWYHTGDVGRLTKAPTPKAGPAETKEEGPEPHRVPEDLFSDVDKHKAQLRLEIIDRANSFLEMYVQHRSVWVPDAIADRVILGRHESSSSSSSSSAPSSAVVVRQGVVCSDRMQSFLVALVVVETPLATTTATSDASSANIEGHLLRSFRERAAAMNKPPFFAPRGVIVVEHKANQGQLPWNVGNGLCSALGKLKKRVIKEKYSNEVHKMFAKIAQDFDEEKEYAEK